MNKANLFRDIKGYSKENLITATFCNTLKKYPALKVQFLKYILAPKRIGIKSLQAYEPRMQVHYENAVPDLEFVSPSNKKIIIENKTDSPEGENQVQKYLDLGVGHVAYLTPVGYPEPELRTNDRLYLGHFIWNDVCKLVEHFNKTEKSEIISDFLEYLEENKMGQTKPLLKREIGFDSFEVMSKCFVILERLTKALRPEWEDLWGKNIYGSGDIKYYPPPDSSISWWLVLKHLRPNNKKAGLYIECDIEYDPNKRGLVYTLCFKISGRTKQFKEILSEREIRDKLSELRKRKTGWEMNYEKEVLQKKFPLEAGDIDGISKKLLKNIRIATKELDNSRLLNLLGKRLK